MYFQICMSDFIQEPPKPMHTSSFDDTFKKKLLQDEQVILGYIASKPCSTPRKPNAKKAAKSTPAKNEKQVAAKKTKASPKTKAKAGAMDDMDVKPSKTPRTCLVLLQCL